MTLVLAVLFPVWHRPYVLALEVSLVCCSQLSSQSILSTDHKQSIGEEATQLVSRLTANLPADSQEKATWEAAAKSLRFP